MTQGPVRWLADGTPRSAVFDDIYRSAGTDGQGGWAQSQAVFLNGCGLSGTDEPAWAGAPHWQILETGFGLGLNFLATWYAWRQDPLRPRLLHHVAIEAWPVSADDVRHSARAFPELQPLAEQLAAHWQGLLPGLHRLVFEEGAVQLSLHIGTIEAVLPTLDSRCDSVYLDGFNPQVNPDMWSPAVMKAVARLCRPGTRVASWTVARPVRDALSAAGFQVQRCAGLPPKRHRLEARYDPPWGHTRSRPTRVRERPPVPWRRQALVVGAGLAGSAVACSLARRGWSVQVLDQGEQVAAGASGLPVGIVAPHVSIDDARLSRLSRAGVRLTLQRAAECLQAGTDWGPGGVLEHRTDGKRGPPDTPDWQRWGPDWSQAAAPETRRAAGLPEEAVALWHTQAAWVRPARLVAAQLQHPLIQWCPAQPVATCCRQADGNWAVLDAAGQVLAQAPVLVLAAAWATRAWLQGLCACTLPLNPLRGQVSWGSLHDIDPALRQALPPFPVHGHGAWLQGMPGPDGQPAWFTGSTFERGVAEACVRAEDHVVNRDKLHRLLPALGPALDGIWPRAQAWAGVRCTLPDRLPAVGALSAARWPGLCVSTGYGARGLSLSVLGGETLAAQLEGEPWPVDTALAHPLLAERFVPAA